MSDPNQMATALALVMEMTAPMREAALGYRQSLIDAGLSVDAASQCAADFHHMVFTQMLDQMSRQRS
jgi:hypothetical protein